MPEAVIDGFEMIEVSDHHSENCAIAPRARYFAIKVLEHRPSIQHARQRVVCGLDMQFAAGGLQCRLLRFKLRSSLSYCA
jgi:hypothetical protein